jgi:hypothetical protein
MDARDDAGLSTQQAADAFAEVASAMLVTVVDIAASESDKGDSNKEATMAALDIVADYVKGAGEVFGKTAAGATLADPVLYNGKTKKGKIEALYLTYLKSVLNIGDLMSTIGAAMGGLGNAEGEGGHKGETEAEVEEKEKLMETRQQNLLCLQQVFAITENKRSGLENKLMREMLMSGEGGLGGMGALGDMFGALGKGGGGEMPDPAALEEMMKSMGGGGGGIPDLSDMDPETAKSFQQNALSSIKEALDRGEIRQVFLYTHMYISRIYTHALTHICTRTHTHTRFHTGGYR